MPTVAEVMFPIVKRAAEEMGLNTYQAILIYTQGVHESANYSSNVFRTDNNAFGMKLPRKRKSPYIVSRGLAAPSGESTKGDPYNYYAHYNSFADSVKDLIHRQNYFGIKWDQITTPEAYVEFCRKTGYFQGSPTVYSNNVASLVKSLGNMLAAGAQNVVTAIKDNSDGLTAVLIVTSFFF